MRETEVNRLDKKVRNVRRNYYKVMEKLLGPRWASGLSVRMSMPNANREKLEANARALINKEVTLQKELNSALNRNATSLRAQQRTIQRQITAIYNAREKASKALKNLNARAARATTNAERAEIEREKMPHRNALRRYVANKPKLQQLEKNRSKIMRDLNERRELLARPPNEEKARIPFQIWKARTFAAPYRRNAAEAVQKHQPTVPFTKYAKVVTNLERALKSLEHCKSLTKRKLNNNNRNNKVNGSSSPKTHQGSPKRARLA